mmetsp:Transcript_56445/g.63128  ORF Transcript_56445/g.63128 Transcript_56445/m.63128 type:complete len:116 (+) Transcript_56445:270-617(+)
MTNTIIAKKMMMIMRKGSLILNYKAFALLYLTIFSSPYLLPFPYLPFPSYYQYQHQHQHHRHHHNWTNNVITLIKIYRIQQVIQHLFAWACYMQFCTSSKLPTTSHIFQISTRRF